MRHVLSLVLVSLVAFALGWVARSERGTRNSSSPTLQFSAAEPIFVGEPIEIKKGHFAPKMHHLEVHTVVSDGVRHPVGEPPAEGNSWIINANGGRLSLLCREVP